MIERTFILLVVPAIPFFLFWLLLDAPLVRRDSFRLGRWAAPEASVVGAAALYAGTAFTCLTMAYGAVMLHGGFVVARRWNR